MDAERKLKGKHLSVTWKESDEPQSTYTPHCHSRYEVYCFLSGLADFRVEGLSCPLQTGSVVLVDSSRFHSVQAMAALGQPYRRAVLHFSAQALHPGEEFLLGLFRRPEIIYPSAWQNGLEPAFQALEAAADLPQNVKEIAFHTRLMGVLVDLYAMSGHAVPIHAGEGRVHEVLAYLNANLTAPITLEALAEKFYFSRNGLARAFRRATGTTVADYMMYKRMALARVLLRAGHPAGVVAGECGYTEYSTFYRNYCRVYGRTPGEPIDIQEDEVPAPALAPDPLAL